MTQAIRDSQECLPPCWLCTMSPPAGDLPSAQLLLPDPALIPPCLKSLQAKWHAFPQIHFLPLLAGIEQSTYSNIFIKCFQRNFLCRTWNRLYMVIWNSSLQDFHRRECVSKETPKPPNHVLELLDEWILVNHKYIPSSKYTKTFLYGK